MGNCNQKKTENNILIESAYNWNSILTLESKSFIYRNLIFSSDFESDCLIWFVGPNRLSLDCTRGMDLKNGKMVNQKAWKIFFESNFKTLGMAMILT